MSLLKTAQYWEARAEDAWERDETSQIVKYKNEGEDLLSRGLYSEASEAFDKALKLKPSIYASDIWIQKGNTFSFRDRFDDAINSYDQALSINQKNANAWYNKGRSLVELKRYSDAIYCFDRAIEINPKDYGAWWGKGNSLYFLGNYEEASFCLDMAIRIKPDEHILWFNRGVIFFQRGELEEAEKYFEKALEINPDSLTVKANLAEIVLMKRQYDKYESLIKEILDLPESENYEFGIRLLNVIYLSLEDNLEEATKATMDLL